MVLAASFSRKLTLDLRAWGQRVEETTYQKKHTFQFVVVLKVTTSICIFPTNCTSHIYWKHWLEEDSSDCFEDMIVTKCQRHEHLPKISKPADVFETIQIVNYSQKT